MNLKDLLFPWWSKEATIFFAIVQWNSRLKCDKITKLIIEHLGMSTVGEN